MGKHWFGIKSAAVASAAILLSFAAVPAQAQAPGGSYLQTCTNVRGGGDRLFAECQRMDGSWARTALNDIGSCAGDIANINGHLTCNRGGPSYGWNRDRFRRFEGYGSSYGPYRYGREYDFYGR